MMILPPSPASPPQFENYPATATHVVPWPEEIAHGTKGRMVAGDVLGDGRQHAILLNGTHPVVIFAPALYETVFELEVEASDLVLLPGAQPQDADDLIVVNGLGLQRIHLDDASHFTVSTLQSGAWQGAKRVCASDTDGDGAWDLVGLSAQDQILFLEDLAGVPVTSVVQMPAPVRDFVPLTWNAGASDQVAAVLCANGCYVVDKTSNVLLFVPLPVQKGVLGVMQQSDHPADRLVIQYTTSGLNYLTVADSSGIETPQPMGLSAFALSVADVDDDGYEDLALAFSTTRRATLLRNLGSVPGAATTFAAGGANSEVVNLLAGVDPPSTWSAWPVLGDLSHDGDPDLLAFLEPTDEFVFFESQRVALTSGQVLCSGGTYTVDENIDEGHLALALEVPATLAFEATHIEVVAFKQVDALWGGEDFDLDYVPGGFYALDGTGQATTDLVLLESEIFSPHAYYCELRAVELDGAGEVLRTGPSSALVFATPDLLIIELEALYGPSTPLETFLIPEGGSDPVLHQPHYEAERATNPANVPTPIIPPGPKVP